MDIKQINPKSIGNQVYEFEFSICTLVTKKSEYAEMLQSFVEKGFSANDCEFLYIDNSEGCKYDAFKGLNLFLQQAKGKYIIICHQDILLIEDDRNQLLKCIEEINFLDPSWAILANAGAVNFKWIATQIIQNNGKKIVQKKLPLRVVTIDENFMLIKKEANLALSYNLSGFHLYGTDICLIADVLGYSSYVINFNLLHKSDGNPDTNFYAIKKALKQKYNKAFRGRFLATTITRFYISGSLILQTIVNTQPILFFVRQYYKHVWHKKHYVPKHPKL